VSIPEIVLSDLIKLSELKEWLEIEEDETKHDNKLAMICGGLIKEIEQDIFAKIQPVSKEVAYLDGRTANLYFPHLNVSEITLWQDFNRTFSDGSIVTAESYQVNSPRGIVKRTDGLMFGEEFRGVSIVNWEKGIEPSSKKELYAGIVKVKYDGGYDADSLPSDLKMAILTQAGYRFRRRKDPGLSSVTYPDGSVNKYMTKQWLSEVEAVLDKYRRIFLA
jgi:hypothetical protein